MTNLILLEDEPILCSELADFLAERGRQVDVADSIDAFRRQYRPGKYSIALVDLGLPDGEGLDLIAWLRGQGESLGVIVLTARTGTRNKTEGLLQGADHYLSKPFDFEELAATVTALSRRLQPDEERQRWVLDTLRCALIPPGKPPIALTAQSYIVFRTIAAGEGLPVDRRRIVEALGENYLDYDQRRLDTQMYQLRKTVSRPAAWSSRCAPRAGGGIRSLKSWTCAAESLVLRFPQFWGFE